MSNTPQDQNPSSPSTVPGAVMIGVGGAIIAVLLFWTAVIGYYDHQLPILLVLALVGGALAFFGQRMYQSAKKQQALDSIERRNAGRSGTGGDVA